MVCSGEMEADEENKKKEPKLSDELVSFIRKRSEREVPRYTAKLKSYLDCQAKCRRAAAARRASHEQHDKVMRKKNDEGQKDKTGDQQRIAEKGGKSRSPSGSLEPSDRCGRRRRRRRSKCKRRRRSCRRKRRRRSRCRRKRRRSCSRRRRRRRRSCHKRRRRCGR